MAEKSEIWYLEEVDLFDILCSRKTPRMETEHPPNQYGKDEYIYFPDQESTSIYMIANGRVKIGSYLDDGKEIVKAILGKGEVFGELALAGENRRSDFAQAMDADTRICSMDIEDLQEMMKDNQVLALKIFKIIGLRFKKMERKIELLVFKDARTQIIEFLKDLAQERGQKVGFETMIKNHFTHKDIASLTGTSRQTVTTVLNELRESNVINFDRRRILIRDVAKLA